MFFHIRNLFGWNKTKHFFYLQKLSRFWDKVTEGRCGKTKERPEILELFTRDMHFLERDMEDISFDGINSTRQMSMNVRIRK
ncbi:804_t:CDS:2 [Acaulospora morrowiae]|uniref:804_t:CDS:1 n=1 Tax=Acaulospora morrowiae TaxID=94023 RepID=A0A9N8ZRJ7_9GLOM|nr:804_t:CDS:2 [Acaulospora morrowiae]